MTEGEKNTSKKKAGPGSVKSDLSPNSRNIERSVEGIFRKFEGKPDAIHKRQEIIEEFPDIRIEIEEKDVPKPVGDKKIPTPKAAKAIQKPKADKSVPKPKPEKNKIKIIRPVYMVGAVLMVAAALTFIMLKPQQAPPPDKPAVTETLHKIVRPVPPPPIESREAPPAQPVPANISTSDEVEAFLMKWKTAWENAAGKGGDMETFMSFYSDSFTSQEMSKNEWRKDKAQKNSLKEWIRLEIKDIRIAEPVTDNRTEVSFLLAYSSSNYSDETYQALILKKEAGDWKIIKIKTANE
ncbi:MAG: hypothetical protein P1P89_14595 [Desulfobacterales bacterium]|nr:hypothetical protein [Desulfobacterales bacterium]